MRREFDRYNIRNIHSVKNRTGCERVQGYWDLLHEICVLRESCGSGFDSNTCTGWTAPIRGAYFYWYIGPLFDYKEKQHFGGAIGAVRIEHDPDYPELPFNISTKDSGIFYNEIPWKKGDNEGAFYTKLRDAALHAARDALAGRASEHDMIYYDKTGETRCTAKSMGDDIGYPPCPGCLPCPPSMHKPKPFKIGR